MFVCCERDASLRIFRNASIAAPSYSPVFRITGYQDTDSRNPGHTSEIRENLVMSLPLSPPSGLYVYICCRISSLPRITEAGWCDAPRCTRGSYVPHSRVSSPLAGFPPLYINSDIYFTLGDGPPMCARHDIYFRSEESKSPVCRRNFTVAFQYFDMNNIELSTNFQRK